MKTKLMAVMPLFLGTTFCLCGCAGPTTPFGAIPMTEWIGQLTQIRDLTSNTLFSQTQTNDLSSANPSIRFFPRYQVQHENHGWTIQIDDSRGIEEPPNVTLSYNRMNLTKGLLLQARITRISQNRIKIFFPSLRLHPTRNHQIFVRYRKKSDAAATLAQYFPSECTAFGHDPILSTDNFDVPDSLIKSIADTASTSGLNPSFLAGLVAQESSFDPKAVSFQKALGLTQVTSLGEAQIIDVVEKWPRFPELSTLSAPLVKLQVLMGEINETNEWRLDPNLSIQGGATYIKHLKEYWSRPANLRVIRENFREVDQEFSRLLIASYNSGPTRVHSALQLNRRNWLEDEELGEAKKYVNQILSYCARFSQPEIEP